MYMPEVMYMGAEFFLTMGFRKTRWPIRLRFLISLKHLEEARDIFEVTISNANNNRVSSLGVEIRNRRLDLFQDIDSSRLVLYKVRDSMSDNAIILDLRNNNVAILNGTVLMNPQNTIYSYFPTQPQPIYAGEKGINVIVYSPRNN